MNVERLHHVARLVLKDMRNTNVAESLARLRDNLQNMINQPAQANHQQQVTSIFGQLIGKLELSRIDDEGETIQQAVRDLGLDDILGSNLSQALTYAFETKAVMPSAILGILKPLADKATKKEAELKALVDSLRALGVGAEELEPGECEVGFLIPRARHEDDLDSLTKELRVYARYLRDFSELTTGTRHPPSVHTISSSDFSFYLGLVPAAAAALAHLVNKVVATYKDLLDIRLKRNELAQLLPGQDLSNIDEAANSRMKEAIGEVIRELLAENSASVEKLGKERASELENALTDAANGIANRLDSGFGIEVRVEPLGEDGEQDEQTSEEERAAVARILELQRQISSFRMIQGPGILSLPERVDGGEEPENKNVTLKGKKVRAKPSKT